jgi:hypothetical protein
MATRMIVTSQPDVACDVCGRRLLRGEQPDVFLAGGRRRTVCELCAPRARAEGWRRETDHHSVSLPPARPRRGRNLLERLRQQRERADAGTEAELSPRPTDAYAEAELPPRATEAGEAEHDPFDGSVASGEPPIPELISSQAPDHGQTARPIPGTAFVDATSAQAEGASTSDDAMAVRALEVFNAGEHPSRVASVARSLGAPSVSIRQPAETGSTVIAIVVAWELCWYRYEVDLAAEATDARVVAQGIELSELAAEDRHANGVAAADGTLSLVGSVAR